MESDNIRGYIMVVNDMGDRKQIKLSDYNNQCRSKEDSSSQIFKYDLDWDLTHGFTDAEKAFEEIENIKRDEDVSD